MLCPHQMSLHGHTWSWHLASRIASFIWICFYCFFPFKIITNSLLIHFSFLSRITHLIDDCWAKLNNLDDQIVAFFIILNDVTLVIDKYIKSLWRIYSTRSIGNIYILNFWLISSFSFCCMHDAIQEGHVKIRILFMANIFLKLKIDL